MRPCRERLRVGLATRRWNWRAKVNGPSGPRCHSLAQSDTPNNKCHIYRAMTMIYNYVIQVEV